MSGAGGKKGGGQVQVIDYRMSVHWSVCAESVDSINKLWINDREVHSIGLPWTDSSVVFTDQMNLFGGSEKGGGIRGQIYRLLGEPTQVMPEFLASKFGRTSATMTGYRGFTSLFFSGLRNEGFTWSTNNPTVPPPEIEVTRYPKTLVGFEAIGTDANPAAIIHECLVNTVWGSGYPETAIDLDSFQLAAQTLSDESLGLSFIWEPEGPVEDFVNDVLRHINGRINFDIQTGKWQLYLLRNDYDVSIIPVIGRSNSKLKDFQRKTWSDVVANLTVSFINPDNEESETVSAYDAAAMAIQSVEVRDNSERYVGIRNIDVAWKVVERDLRQRSALLSTAKVEIPMAMDGISPGRPVLFDWTDDPVNDESDFKLLRPIVMRVMDIQPTRRNSSSMSVTLAEDIFSYGETPRPVYVPPVLPIQASDPEDVDVYALYGSPFYLVAIRLGDANARSMEYPETSTMILANSDGGDVRDIALRRAPDVSPDPILDNSYRSVGLLDNQPSFVLTSSLSPEVQTTISDTSLIGGLTVGDYLWVIRPAGLEEVVEITDVDFIADQFTVSRGLMDTIPRSHPMGMRVIGLAKSSNSLDLVSHAAGAAFAYRLLPSTSLGALPLEDATARLFVAEDRMHLPTRPANLTFNAQSGFAFSISESVADYTVGWSWRNRLTETGQLLRWDDISVEPEANQQLTINLLRNGSSYDTVTITDQALTQHTFSPAALDREVGDVFTVEFVSVRNGFEAYQIPILTLTLE